MNLIPAAIIAEEIIDTEPEEIWTKKNPVRGNHIRVQRMDGIYFHHGIFISADEVIHFTGDEDDSIFDWSKAHVTKTNLKIFLNGGEVEVKEYNDEEISDLYPVEGIVNYARSCLGDDGYDLFFNNCEHFANACTLGKYRSRQVEGVFGMGLFGKIKNFLFGSSDSSTKNRETTNYDYKYVYEPDKVRVAEIERETKLGLADRENERIELMKEAQKEFFQMQTISRVAIEKARAEGMAKAAEQLVILQEKMLDVAKKRIAIIEEGSLPIIRDIENFYNEIGEKIQAASDDYNTKKLPQLLQILRQYEKDSPEHEIYFAQIQDDRARQNNFLAEQLQRISERQNLVLQSFLSSKEKIIEQTGQITQQIAEGYIKNSENLLPPNQSDNQNFLPKNEMKLLQEKIS